MGINGYETGVKSSKNNSCLRGCSSFHNLLGCIGICRVAAKAKLQIRWVRHNMAGTCRISVNLHSLAYFEVRRLSVVLHSNKSHL